MRGQWAGEGGERGVGGKQIPVELTGILRLKDDSNSLPLGVSSLRMSFSLFQGCVSVSPGQNSLLGAGYRP